MAHCRVAASLRVSALDDDVPDLFDRLPAGRSAKTITDRKDRNKSRHVWTKSSGLPEEAHLEEHLLVLLELAEQVLDEVRQAGRVSSDLFIGLFVDDGQGGDSLRPETMARIAALNLSLELDIYAGWE